MGFLFSIFIFGIAILFVILLFVLGFIRTVFSGIFGSGRQSRNDEYPPQSNFGKSKTNSKKVFEQNEGEYVDYEDIK